MYMLWTTVIVIVIVIEELVRTRRSTPWTVIVIADASCCVCERFVFSTSPLALCPPGENQLAGREPSF
jgi:hypothetical protein